MKASQGPLAPSWKPSPYGGEGGPEGAADLVTAQAKAAAAADMLGQLAACLAASAGVELAAAQE